MSRHESHQLQSVDLSQTGRAEVDIDQVMLSEGSPPRSQDDSYKRKACVLTGSCLLQLPIWGMLLLLTIHSILSLLYLELLAT